MKQGQLVDILQSKLAAGLRLYSPLDVQNFEFQYQLDDSAGHLHEVDAVVELRWRDRRVRCAVTAQGQGTPRAVRNMIAHGRNEFVPPDLAAEPVILVPYLSDGVADQLEEFGISGLDPNGNYLILTSALVAIRLDQPNEYPESRDIKKIYSYNSSIVGRFLLTANRTFEQVNEIYDGIQELGGGISLSTVSKVLKGMEGDMIISKKRGEIRLLQPPKLLDRLREGYREPRVGRRLELKLPRGEEDEILTEILGEENWIWDGETAAEAYAATTSSGVRRAYARKFVSSMEPLRKYEDSRFYSCVIEQCEDDFVYFDRRGRCASPVEAYLALSQLDKRERELARSIRENVILAEFESNV